MTKTRALVLLAVLLLLLMLPVVASAQQAPPHVFVIGSYPCPEITLATSCWSILAANVGC